MAKANIRAQILAKDLHLEASVGFNRVKNSYDGETLLEKDLKIEIPKSELLSVLGQSGSDKVPYLMMLACFETAIYGKCLLD